MQIKDVIESLAKEANLIVRGKSDNRLLRFRGPGEFFAAFVIDGTDIVGLRSSDKYKFPPYGASPTSSSYSAKFNLCDPDSLSRILAFMNDD